MHIIILVHNKLCTIGWPAEKSNNWRWLTASWSCPQGLRSRRRGSTD